MAKKLRLRVLLQVCALLGGAMTLLGQEPPSVAEACAWCTGPYTCTGNIKENGYTGCKVEGGAKCEHTGNACFYSCTGPGCDLPD